MTKEHSPVREQQGPTGDVIPTNDGRDARTGGGQKPEPVEQRRAVGTVSPEDYPIEERQVGLEPPDGE